MNFWLDEPKIIGYGEAIIEGENCLIVAFNNNRLYRVWYDASKTLCVFPHWNNSDPFGMDLRPPCFLEREMNMSELLGHIHFQNKKWVNLFYEEVDDAIKELAYYMNVAFDFAKSMFVKKPW